MATPDAPSQPVCLLGVSEHTLSTLRAAGLSRDEDARLAAHVEQCPACGARLAAFDALAAALRSERPPAPDERLWHAITAAAGSSSPARRPHFAGTGPTRLSWSRLTAIAAVLLLMIGFVALFDLYRPASPVQPLPTATPNPTLTPAPTIAPTATAIPLLPAHPLAWQPVSGSAPIQLTAIAGDGRTAYKCSVGDNAQGASILNIWHTADLGVHWIPAREVPVEPTINDCSLLVDTSDPTVAALAWQPRGGGAGDSYTGLLTTVDGGVTWQAAPSEPFTQINQLDSRGGVIYALRETVDSANSVENHLWASSDRMRSWRQVDDGLPALVAGFWLEPQGSGLLIIASSGVDSPPSQLWSSPDGGRTWHQLNVPGGLPPYAPARLAPSGAPEQGIVARSLQGHFQICVSDAAAASQISQPPEVTCSFDGGVTWNARAMPLLTSTQDSTAALKLVGITNDGTLLATGLGTLYRIAVNSDRWQSLGALPEPAVLYCPSPGAGILLSIPFGGSIDPQNRIFTTGYSS